MLSIRVATRVTLVPFIGDGSFILKERKMKKEEFLMLDVKYLRANFEEVKGKLQHRGEDLTDFGKF